MDSHAEGAAEAAEDTGQGKQALPPKFYATEKPGDMLRMFSTPLKCS